MIKEGCDYNTCLDEIWKKAPNKSFANRKIQVIIDLVDNDEDWYEIDLYLYEYNHFLKQKWQCICGKELKHIRAVKNRNNGIILILGSTCIKYFTGILIIKKKNRKRSRSLKFCENCNSPSKKKLCGYCKELLLKKCEYCDKLKIEKTEWQTFCPKCYYKCKIQEERLFIFLKQGIKYGNKRLLANKILYFDKYKHFIEKTIKEDDKKKLQLLISKSYDAINGNNPFYLDIDKRACLKCLKFKINKSSLRFFCKSC